MTSPIYKRGVSTQSLPQPEWSVSNNGRGLLEGTGKIYFDSNNKIPESAPTRGDAHPYDERLLCYQVETSFQRNQMGYIEAKYVGIEEGDRTDVEWTLSGSVQDFSVRFHPKWEEWCIAGNWYPNTPVTEESKGLIVFDSNGQFKAFGSDHPLVPNVENFSAPAGNCKVSWVTKNMDWMDYAYGLGKQCQRPPHAPYMLAAQNNLSWLLTACSVSQYGTIFKVELDFTLSVLGKPFNEFMYDPLTADGK